MNIVEELRKIAAEIECGVFKGDEAYWLTQAADQIEALETKLAEQKATTDLLIEQYESALLESHFYG